MIEHRPFSSLGQFKNDWLDANYHFSFSRYIDRSRMGHGALRVWNDDTIQPHTGFPTHGHESMEIITYVRSGAITHTDSMGNKGRTEAGDVQVMSAGSGIQHSEWNAEDTTTTVFQLWITPKEAGGAPDWGARTFPKADKSGQWVVFASGTGEDDSLVIKQDAKVMGARLKAGETLTYNLTENRFGYLVLAAGTASLNGIELSARDGAAISNATQLSVTAIAESEIVFVDTV